MTSVNSPASLLARNHFYRSWPSSPEVMNSTSQQNDSVVKRVVLCISMEVPPGLPVATGSKRLLMEFSLGSSSSANTKRSKPGDQHVK